MHLICRISKYIFVVNTFQNSVLTKNVFPLLRFYSAKSNYEINLQLHGKSLKKYISSLEREYQSLFNDNSKSRDLRKQELQPVMHILERRSMIVENLVNLSELLNSNDEDLKKLAEQEKQELEIKIKELDEHLLLSLIPKDKEEMFDSLILEVQAGVGGQEAMLFAKEMFEMYQKFATYKGNSYDRYFLYRKSQCHYFRMGMFCC